MKEKVTSDVDRVYDMVKQKNMMGIDEIAVKLGVPYEQVEEWAAILDSSALLKLVYPANPFKDPYLAVPGFEVPDDAGQKPSYFKAIDIFKKKNGKNLKEELKKEKELIAELEKEIGVELKKKTEAEKKSAMADKKLQAEIKKRGEAADAVSAAKSEYDALLKKSAEAEGIVKKDEAKAEEMAAKIQAYLGKAVKFRGMKSEKKYKALAKKAGIALKKLEKEKAKHRAEAESSKEKEEESVSVLSGLAQAAGEAGEKITGLESERDALLSSVKESERELINQESRLSEHKKKQKDLETAIREGLKRKLIMLVFALDIIAIIYVLFFWS